MTVTRYIKNEAGQEIDLSAIRGGHILSNVDADDYGFKKGDTYKVHYSNGFGCIFADGQINLDGEIRADILAQLIWIND